VTFICPTGPGRVRAITFERGVEDFTLACGTGAGATAVSLGESVQVEMPGGTLSIRLVKDGDTVKELYLTGPTEVENGKR
jgi:diaminopimelate epimerase